jgi:hypothetical protein
MNYVLIVIFLGAVAFFGGVALLFVYLRRDQAIGAVAKRDDLASMMILLQTMRDLLEQQKGFARELNKALDTRVKFIKTTVESARNELAAVGESVKRLGLELERIKHEAETAAARPPAPAQPANVRQLSAYAPPQPAQPAPPKEHERPALRVLAMPREQGAAGDAIDSWVGLDFAGDNPEPLGFEVPESEPEAPHDADAARSAFRALLDLAPEAEVEKNTAAPVQPAAPPIGNGRTVPPIHARVYEYNDAGMNVAQIAQELGIGKGEARLILSLRKGKGS